jgi:hypothetical protein
MWPFLYTCDKIMEYVCSDLAYRVSTLKSCMLGVTTVSNDYNITVISYKIMKKRLNLTCIRINGCLREFVQIKCPREVMPYRTKCWEMFRWLRKAHVENRVTASTVTICVCSICINNIVI